ncbi:cleavage and polyadenylation specifity factor-related protein [Reinekea sp. MED297]|uniref:Cleavage and polyadenylation specifity factor-related protein n=1 Tax=Reinekea blandensis MED297 TaxID=314283 RepID=A4BH85_9GAMM|nr:cleavage and polyadenylation specifity factor-related protein [Reinekea sp. MED297] [Reinekea blandensis MED297]
MQQRDAVATGINDLKAQVHTVSGFSALVDQEDLLAFVAGIESKPGEVRLVHGDASAKRALQQELMSQLALERVLVVK